MFADDVKLIYPRSEWAELELSIKRAWRWSVDWDLPINASKCSHLCIGASPPSSLKFTEDGEVAIPLDQNVSDLGVNISSDFTPTAHCLSAVNKARGRLFAMRRAFVHLTPDIFTPLYAVFVRPLLEYCVQAVSPYLNKDINHAERLQRVATRMVHGLGNLSYEERLNRLNLFSLRRRRLRGDLITAYNIFTGKIDIPVEHFFQMPTRPGLRGHIWKVLQRPARLQRRRYCFSNRVAPFWNKLPSYVVQATSVTQFKMRLDDGWLLIFPDYI